MKNILLSLAISLTTLPFLITAQCPACDSYTAALKSCQTTSANVTAIGGTMDTASVHCMCASSSNASLINTCQGCIESNPLVSATLDFPVVLAWGTTCKAANQFGEPQAVACWQGQPGNYLPCVSKTVGNGGGSSAGGSGGTSLAPRYIDGHLLSFSGCVSLTYQSPSTPANSQSSATSMATMPYEILGAWSAALVGLSVVLSI